MDSVPQLGSRTLRIHPDLDKFYYQYETCVKKALGICIKKGMIQEIYQFNNKEQIKQLKDMGYSLTPKNQI